MSTYNITFLKSYQSRSGGLYSAGESAAFSAGHAAYLFAAGIGSLSSDDQTTLASQILAAQATCPQQPVAVTMQVNPDGSVSARTANRQVPPYSG